MLMIWAWVLALCVCSFGLVFFMAWVVRLARAQPAFGQHDYGPENVFFPGEELARVDILEGC